MTEETPTTTRPIRSGEFLLVETDPAGVFIPENLDEEERAIGSTTARFVAERVGPKLEAIEAGDLESLEELVREIGELGVFLIDVPEELEGLGATKKVSMLISEAFGTAGSFGVAALVQTGIGGLPVIYFGNDDQRAKYLEGITSGQIITAYALTEPESGSDAMSARTTATWDESRQVYLLNGSKQFITNAGFADLFITFAQVDGDKFTCFLVDAETDGLSTGVEEQKMGLKGSSTRAVTFENVAVSKENILGEIGRGHRIAFNVLNIGRLKLAPAVLGGSKRALKLGAVYSSERQQFGQPIANFGLIQQKLSGAAMRIYSSESMVYRTADLLDRIAETEKAKGATDPVAPSVAALRELAIECSINKVYGSETLDWVADEMLQVHGGYGYTQEYPVEGIYRDARINRIWEGTSEVNRMIITGTLMGKAMKGQLPILAEVKKLAGELMERRGRGEEPTGVLGAEKASIALCKKMTLFAAGVAAQKYLMKLKEEQEILGWLADMVIQTYAMESVWLRTLRSQTQVSEDQRKAREAAVRLALDNGFPVVEQNAKRVLAASHAGEELRSSLSMLKKLTRREPSNVVEDSRILAQAVLDAKGYPFD